MEAGREDRGSSEGRGLRARLERLRDGGVVHGESTYLFQLSLES